MATLKGLHTGLGRVPVSLVSCPPPTVMHWSDIKDASGQHRGGQTGRGMNKTKLSQTKGQWELHPSAEEKGQVVKQGVTILPIYGLD